MYDSVWMSHSETWNLAVERRVDYSVGVRFDGGGEGLCGSHRRGSEIRTVDDGFDRAP